MAKAKAKAVKAVKAWAIQSGDGFIWPGYVGVSRNLLIAQVNEDAVDGCERWPALLKDGFRIVRVLITPAKPRPRKRT